MITKSKFISSIDENKKNKKSDFDLLPNELLLKILEFNDLSMIPVLKKTSRKIYIAFNSNRHTPRLLAYDLKLLSNLHVSLKENTYLPLKRSFWSILKISSFPIIFFLIMGLILLSAGLISFASIYLNRADYIYKAALNECKRLIDQYNCKYCSCYYWDSSDRCTYYTCADPYSFCSQDSISLLSCNTNSDIFQNIRNLWEQNNTNFAIGIPTVLGGIVGVLGGVVGLSIFTGFVTFLAYYKKDDFCKLLDGKRVCVNLDVRSKQILKQLEHYEELVEIKNGQDLKMCSDLVVKVEKEINEYVKGINNSPTISFFKKLKSKPINTLIEEGQEVAINLTPKKLFS